MLALFWWPESSPSSSRSSPQSSSSTLVLGSSGYSHTGGDDNSATHSRSFRGLFEYTKDVASTLEVYVQGKQYASLTKTLTADGEPPATADYVLRTPKVYADRQRLYLAYQLKDEFGSVNVKSGEIALELC